MQQLVSIILPVYNYDSYISETIESVLAQSYPHFELLIINDGSTDGTEKLILEYAHKDSRITYLPNKRNLGVSASRNRGLKEAKGEFIAFIDGDDLWMEEKLEKQMKLFNSHPEIEIINCAGIIIDPEGNEKKTFRALGETVTNDLILDLLFYCRISALMLTLIIRRSTLNGNSFFDERLQIYEDRDFIIEHLTESNYLPIEEPLVKLRRHPKQATSTKLYEDIISYKIFSSRVIKKLGNKQWRYVLKAKAEKNIYWSRIFLNRSQAWQSMSRLFKAIRYYPLFLFKLSFHIRFLKALSFIFFPATSKNQ